MTANDPKRAFIGMMLRKLLPLSALALLSLAGIAARAGDPFDSRGYYLPVTDVVVDGYRVEAFGVANSHKAEIHLTRLRDNRRKIWKGSGVVTPEKTKLTFRRTPIGQITVQGTFLDKRGRFWDQPDIESTVTVVFEGRIEVRQARTVQLSRDESFAYFEGD